MTIFEQCRSIKAEDVARQLGIPITQQGKRSWALCPFHEEKTPSLLFYSDGKWRCFGCNEHGDAVSFYAKVKNLKPYQAAKELLSSVYPKLSLESTLRKNPHTSNVKTLRHLVDKWLKDKHREAYENVKKYQKLIDCELAWLERDTNPECIYDASPLFDQWVHQRNQAWDVMERLDPQKPYEMMLLMLEEINDE